MGRRTKYRDDFPLRVQQYAREGLSEKQIAKNLGVSHQTFNQYKHKYPEFLDALTKGKAPVDTQVENALLKKALGYEYVEVHETETFENGHPQTIVKRVTKHIPPDTTACKFWLANRMKDRWRERLEHEHTGDVTITIDKDDESL